LDGYLGLDGGNSGVDILGDEITSVNDAACHVLSVTGVALGHHGGGLEDGIGDLSDGELLMVRLLGRNDGSVRRKHKMDTGIGHQIGLELGDINVERTIETKGSGQGRNDLSNESVKIRVSRALDIQIAAANVVQSLVINLVGHVSVFQKRMDAQDCVVRFDDSGGDLGTGPHGERDLGLLAIIDGASLHQQRAKATSGATTDGMVNHEALKTGAIVGQLTEAIQSEVNNFFTDGVMTTGEIVRGVFFAGDQLLGMEELSVGTGANFVNDGGFQIKKDGTGNVFAGTGLREEGVEGIITATDGLVRGHLAIRLDTMFETEELPAGVTDLDTGLTDVDADRFTHDES
jgi:hypothetical protein